MTAKPADPTPPAKPADRTPPAPPAGVERDSLPGSLIVTFAGLYLRELGGWIAVADLIGCLAATDVPAPAVRQALVRLKSRGLLAGERRGSTAGYALTGPGRADLAVGDERIYRFGQADPAAGWVLAVFSVPEQDRAYRHRLRALLAWLGFGTVGPGVWVAPEALADRARAALAAEDLDRYVRWFAAWPVDRAEVETWWDLDGLARLYSEFLQRWESSREVGDHLSDDAVFGAHLRLVDEWRLFPRIDPGLPAELLPGTWPGRTAWELFAELHDRWRSRSHSFVGQIIAGGQSRSG